MIKYLAKFFSEKNHAQTLINGTLHMRPACYYHNLNIGQGDIYEACVFPGICIYKNENLPIYCLYSIHDSDISSNIVKIPKKCITDFSCQDGYIVLIDFLQFKQLLKTVWTNGKNIHFGSVCYQYPKLCGNNMFLYANNAQNLFIKNPYFSYQKEYRIVVEENILCTDSHTPMAINYHFPCTLENITNIFPIPTLPTIGEEYILSLN